MIVNTPSCDQKPLPHKIHIAFGSLSGIWKPEWDSLPSGERFIVKARQGEPHLCIEEVDVRDSITMKKVPTDEVNDRLKDNIIYGGENISTVEVERALYSHPAVTEAAVVARPDNHWGQTPCAFAKLKEGSDVRPQETINFCRDNLPHYMAPWTVTFQELLKLATEKIQKFLIREKAKALGSLF
ncbi:hypothetical protein BC332_03577 [Capsicum chinense]|nr:hypothetical protein BC332_03577 [Capsicum chinense]